MSAPFVPHKPGWKEKAAVRAVYLLIRALFLTVRTRVDDRSGQIKGGKGPIIFCTWHNRMAMTMLGYHRYFKKHRDDQSMAALISASKDGGFLAELFELFGVQPVRGSSSRRGNQAMLEAATWVRKGGHIAITPDGPRGPCYHIHEGILGLAQVTGAPILPVSNRTRWRFALKSWDRFQIPLPFARCDLIVGEPMFVPREATEEDRARLREDLRLRMNAITQD